MDDRFERDVLVATGRFTAFPFTLLGYSMIFMLWISVVTPLMVVIWTVEFITWLFLLYELRRFVRPSFTRVLGLDWIRSFEHPSHARRREQRRRDLAKLMGAGR